MRKRHPFVARSLFTQTGQTTGLLMSRNDGDAGSGKYLPPAVLLSASLCSLLATLLSCWSIWLQLKNYRKIHLQRWVVRILVVPVYAISSFVSLTSTSAAFFVDAFRDVYEAFVIYCFFSLLVEYLGGERSLIIAMHGRPPTSQVFPMDWCLPPLDISDPFSFLALKRGILQYVQIKPVLALLTVILKAVGKYTEGTLAADNGYTYISVVYNISVAVSLYCLVLFWACAHDDLLPFRPMPKFLCVKLIVFFTFWQSFCLSILVSAGAITYPGYGKEDLALALSDMLICYEMPFFAFGHLYAFSHTDYIDNNLYAGRMPFLYALRDSLFGFKDVLQDSLTTFRGTGFSYRTFEPAEGGIHKGTAREKRFRAGLRYTDGGKSKYWLPMPGAEVGEAYGRKRSSDKPRNWREFIKRPIEETQKYLTETRMLEAGYAPIAPEQAADVVHADSRLSQETRTEQKGRWEDASGNLRAYDSLDATDSEDSGLEFDQPDGENEQLFEDAKRLEFGDYNHPVVDASKEEARRRMREEEDAVLHGRSRASVGRESSAAHSNAKGKGKDQPRLKQALSNAQQTRPKKKKRKSDRLPEGCVDIVVEDRAAEEAVEGYVRNKGEANELAGRQRRIFRTKYQPSDLQNPVSSNDPEDSSKPDEPENMQEVAMERGPSHGDGPNDVVQPIADVHLTREMNRAPDFVAQSGLVPTEHGGSPTAKNPWLG